MIANIFIPVADTESAKFEFQGNLSREAYENMVYENFRRTDKQVDAFMHRDRNRGFVYDVEDEQNGEYYDDSFNDKDVEFEALLLDSDRNDFEEDELFDLADSENMFVLIINVNPDGLDEDAESEIKYWLEDSLRVWRDEEIDKRTKLLTSPPRDLKIVLSDGNKYTLKNCKIFEDYSDDRFPLYFALIVEKITL